MSDMNGEWIWVENTDEVNQYAEFVGSFSTAGKTARLALSVTGNYCVYINGRFVACARFDDYPEYKFYDEIEIGECLSAGENEIVLLCYAMQTHTCRSVKMPPAVMAEIVGEEGTLFATREGMKCRLSPRYRSGDMPMHGNGKSYASELYMDFADTPYQGACKAVGYSLFKRPCKRCETGERLPSTLITQGVFRVDDIVNIGEKLHGAWLSYRHLSKMSDEYEKVTFPSRALEMRGNGENIYMIFDLGAEQNGYFSFDFELKESALVEFAFGEHLEDLRVRSEIGNRNFTSVIHGKKGKNEFTDYINRLGCRYLQVHIYADYCKVSYFGLVYDGYPVTVYPYETDNALRKKIYEASVRTLKECMHEHYEDCPWREQALYAMDSRNQMLCGYYAFREYEFARANLVLLLKRLQSDGHTVLTAPGIEGLTIPIFSLVLCLSVREYAEHSGDWSLVEEVFPALKRIVGVFLPLVDETGLLKRFVGDNKIWNFYEWTEGMWNNWGDHPLAEGSVEYPLVLNAFFAVALDNYAFLAKKTGREFSDCERVSVRVKEAIANKFWQEEKGCFASYETDGVLSYDNEISNAMALYCGAGTRSQRERVAKLLMTEGALAPMTSSMTAYKYQALIDLNEKNVEYVLNDIDEKWGRMLYRGATTFWETLVGADDFGGAASLCHGWSAIPAYFYKRYGEKKEN